MFKRLWADEGGAILSAELILIMTILVIGGIVGLKALQNAIVTELADVAAAIGSLNQSFQVSGSAIAGGTTGGSIGTAVAGSSFLDQLDFADAPGSNPNGGAQGVIVAGLVTPGEDSGVPLISGPPIIP